MTGAVGEMVMLKERDLDPEKLWKRMLTSNDQEFGALLAAGIFAPRDATIEREIALESGLFARHAYSVTAAKEVSLTGELRSNGFSFADTQLRKRLCLSVGPW